MNEYQENLYNDLMRLTNEREAFYYVDQNVDGEWYRIFNYRLASYTDFLEPNALECRGHMFHITEEGNDAEMLRLTSLPVEKFFNLNENPLTVDVDLTEVNVIEEKADGSLISTYVHVSTADEDGFVDNTLRLKSKGSLYSDQAIAAMVWLDTEHLFRIELWQLASLGYTVNMEWVAPDNRIVIGYEDAELRVLNIRNTLNGSYVEPEDLHESFSEVRSRWTPRVEVDDPVAFVQSIPDMVGVEGYVVRLNSGQRIKIKSTWYMALHHTKDSINSPRRLFEAVLEEATDDMKSLFHDDPVAIKMIGEMEAFVEEKYNHMVDTVERFHERNKHLDRKEYAILGQQELDRMYFGLAMNKYTGKSVDYKTFLKSKWKQLGLKDVEKENE